MRSTEKAQQERCARAKATDHAINARAPCVMWAHHEFEWQVRSAFELGWVDLSTMTTDVHKNVDGTVTRIGRCVKRAA